jgi:hypothetical protein
VGVRTWTREALGLVGTSGLRSETDRAPSLSGPPYRAPCAGGAWTGRNLSAAAILTRFARGDVSGSSLRLDGAWGRTWAPVGVGSARLTMGDVGGGDGIPRVEDDNGPGWRGTVSAASPLVSGTQMRDSLRESLRNGCLGCASMERSTIDSAVDTTRKCYHDFTVRPANIASQTDQREQPQCVT